MKNFLFLCGPIGIGMTTICKSILNQLPGSAYVDSDDSTIPTIAKNISGLIGNYLECNAVQTVIFSYGFHGRRKEVFDRAVRALPMHELRFVPFALICSVEENLRRMKADGRDVDRMERALKTAREAYGDIEYPQIDVTDLSAEEAAAWIIDRAGLRTFPDPAFTKGVLT